MKKFIMVLMTICLTFCVVWATAPGVIEAVITECQIVFNGGPINSHLENPVISYNDRTYIAVRDVAKILNQEVRWSEKYNTIEMHNKKYPVDNYVITNYDDAITIGKVIIKRFFPDDVTDKTFYEAFYCTIDYLGAKPFYEVCAKFNESGSDELIDAWDVEWDVTVEIDAQSGEVLRVIKYDGKNQTKVYPVEH